MDVTNPDCENYDPCHNKRASADFTITQYNGWFVEPGNEAEFCDTVFGHHNGGGGAQFTAIMKGANEYWWQIGTDTRKFSGKQLSLKFSNWLKDTINNLGANPDFYKPIPITLFVKSHEKECIPKEDTLMVMTKNLVFCRKEIHYGAFRGRFSNENQDRTLEFYRYYDSTEQNMNLRWKYIMINLPHIDSLACPMHIGGIGYKIRSYKQLWWDIGRNDYNPFTEGMNKWKMYINPKPDGKDEVTIEYRYTGKNDTKPNEGVFKGIRVR